MKIKTLVAGAALFFAVGCGGSSSNDGVLFRGTVAQGEEKKSNILAHEVGDRLPGVQICGLGNCDTTNRSGVWSFAFNGARDDSVLFTVKEHGADTSFMLHIPQQAKRVEIEKLLHTEEGDHDDDDDHDHDHGHGHSHDDGHGHTHRSLIKHRDLMLPANNQVSVVRVLIDGMEYADAHDFYSHDHHGHDDHDHEHGHDDGHGHN